MDHRLPSSGGGTEAPVFDATVRAGRVSARAWRVFVAIALFLLLVTFTEPRANWPLGVALLCAGAALRWWHVRTWHGDAVFLLQPDAGGGQWAGTLFLRPALELLPESYLLLRLDLLDNQGRVRTVWHDSRPVEPPRAVDALSASFEVPPAPVGQKLRWVLTLDANTPAGKVGLEILVPVSPALEPQPNSL